MDNPQFLALIHHLGDDVGYISRRMEQDVAKCVGNLKSTGDVKKFCGKLAAVLLNFRMYATMYAHTLEERILTYQLDGELPDVLASLNELTQKKDNTCKQCEQNAQTLEKLDVHTQTEQDQAVPNLASSNLNEQVIGEKIAQSDSSQETLIYDNGLKLTQLLTSQEVSPENDATPNPPLVNDSLSSESLHSIQETVLNRCNDIDATTTDGSVNCDQATEIEQLSEQSEIFTIETDKTNHSVDLEIKDTINHLLDKVCTALSKSGEEVDHLLEELSNVILETSPNTNQTEKVDFLKTLDITPNCEEPVKKKLTDEDRLALLKVIKQFCVKKIRGRRSRKIVEEAESSSDEMLPAQKPQRKKKKRSLATEREGEGLMEESSPAQLTDSTNDKPGESEDASLFSSLEPPVSIPVRRKPVPLPDTPSEDTESQVVLPFKRNVIKPLPSSHSEFEEDDGVLQKKGAKRLRPSSESDLESLKEPQTKRPRLLSESSCSQFKLDSTGRDELLTLLKQTPPPVRKAPAARIGDASDSDVEFVSIEPVKVQFSLNSSERDDLLNLLCKKEHTTTNNNNEGTSSSESLHSSQSQKTVPNWCNEDSESLTSFHLNNKDRDELVELLIQSSLERNNDLTDDRDTLIELIKEFEGSLANESLSGSKDCEVPTAGSFAGSLDAGSPLLDILREETVEEDLTAKRGRGRPKVHNKETWEAFEALLDTDDDLLSSSSSSELSDSDLSFGLKGLNRKVQPALSKEIKTEFGLDKELFVDLEQADFSHFDLSEFAIPNSGFGHTSSDRKPRLSSSTSSLASNMDLDSLGSDVPNTPPPFSADEEPARLAASLLDNITNSSDEDDLSEGGASSSTKSSTGKEKKKVELDSSDEEDFVGVRKSVPAWKRNPLLNMDVSNSESEDSEPKKRKKKSINLDADSDDSDVQIVNKKTSPLKTFQLDDDSDDSDFEIVSVYPKETAPQKVITLSDEEVGKSSKGRRNIRALMEEEDLSEATQTAHNEERERIKRLQEKDKAMEVFSQSLSFASQFSEDDCHPLILDVQDTAQIKVHPKIAIKLKPHQRDGIKFMWDSCYESVKQLQAGYKGSGCILAHCMGLGKTLQALALIQTLFANPITKTKHVLVVCPLSTVSNWKNEYKLAFKDLKVSDVKFYSIEDKRAANMRFNIVQKWRRSGGMLVMGYECFGLMVNEDKLKKWANAGVFDKESILQALVHPGPDLVICDEGHLLRNKQSQRTLALNKVSTRRRIILTGTPLQNNLLEYYYMVNFVKPNLLGTEKEYKINFVNPIVNGQFEDSTAEDIMFMKKRTHVLHKILNRTVQRVEDTELKQYLPKLIDQAVFVKLSDLQVELYNTYLDSTNSRPVIYTKSGTINRKNFLADVQILRYICVHPNVITTAEKNAKAKIREQDVIGDVEDDLDGKMITKGGWYKNLLTADRSQHLSAGSKLLLALGIVEEAAANGDKTLIFSQSHAEMDNLEKFLVETLNYKNKRDYYRMDGTISPEVRTHMCDRFNHPDNRDIKVFIMSTKVGGLGLNLTAANRVVIMSVSWNPSYDTQSVFRSFRFGQNKSVYVYRLIAMDTMEEKMYQRSVTKLAIAHRVVDKHQITRHYNSADIQEYYSVRPTKDKTRPVPNLPEDCILAKLIQKHQVLFKWHEHQALLTNRPEEDLDEQQKNAAWEEFNKKTDPALVNLGPAILNSQNPSNRVVNPAALVNSQIVAAHPDHTYSLPKPGMCPSFEQRTTSAEDFRPVAVIKRHPVLSLNRPRLPTNQIAAPTFTAVKPQEDDRKKAIQAILSTQAAKIQKEQHRLVQLPNAPTLSTDKLDLQKVTPVTLKRNNAIGPKGVVIKATPTVRTDTPASVNRQSPMQQQVRSYMEQLHMLQERSYLSKSGGGVALKAAKNLTNFTTQVNYQSGGSEKNISVKQPNKTYSRNHLKGVNQTSLSTVNSQGQLQTGKTLTSKSGNRADHIPYTAVNLSKPVMLVGVGNKPSRAQVKPLNILSYAPVKVNHAPRRLEKDQTVTNAKVCSTSNRTHPLKVMNRGRRKVAGHTRVNDVKVGHAPKTLNRAQPNNITFNSRTKPVDLSGQGKKLQTQGCLKPFDLSSSASKTKLKNVVKIKPPNSRTHTPVNSSSNPNNTSLNQIKIAPQNSGRGRGNGQMKTNHSLVSYPDSPSTKPSHASNLHPQTNKVKQDVTDWITDTLKYINTSTTKQNGESVKPISPAHSTNRNSTDSGPSKLPTNPNGRLVVAPPPVGASRLAKIQWKRKCPPLDPSKANNNLKKKNQPRTDKENFNVQPSDLVQSLQKKGVSVNRVNTSSR